MKLGILGAMPEEVAPILETIGEYKTEEYGNNKYYIAEYKGVELVIAYSKIGKVFAAITATTMIERYGIEQLLFSGVAGAISPELNIGDMTYASKLCQHDLDITIFGHPYGFVPEGSVYVESDSALNSVAKSVAAKLGIGLKESIIATGDQFIASEEKKNWIGETFKADALEMEGASVAFACSAFNIPFFILRAISDAADMDADFSFEKFLESSAKVSADFVMKMVEEIGASN